MVNVKDLNGVERAIVFFGSKSELARALGVKHQAITYYDNRGEFPFEKAYMVERLTKGVIKAHDCNSRIPKG